MNTEDHMTNHLNGDPVIYRGLSFYELLHAVGRVFLVSLVFCFCVALVFFSITFDNLPLVGIAVLLLSTILFFLYTRYLEKKKKDKPSGYFEQETMIKLQELKLSKENFLLRSGNWSVERDD